MLQDCTYLVLLNQSVTVRCVDGSEKYDTKTIRDTMGLGRSVMSRKPDVHVPTPRLPPGKAEEVRILLEQVIGSHLFKGGRRCQILLRYITERTLAGDTRSEERRVGKECRSR